MSSTISDPWVNLPAAVGVRNVKQKNVSFHMRLKTIYDKKNGRKTTEESLPLLQHPELNKQSSFIGSVLRFYL